MSDENRSPSGGAMAMYVHYCIAPGCKEWGSRGFDRGRGVTDWYCFEHRAHGESSEHKISSKA
ncbi:hypothetical protein ASG25_10505 [Rhizobium sp. Leaf384]|uniref:hypothetical protein n=1 Tax=Rhizobium sp. Leaf384 TaxID=1736358 RepID=UPI0007155BF7|nr:hypothetical protein [Rhizobium sp. Leaf384]KQS79011.1 hypothetical protein ASG25_10505 [Rhizobium sp. Leaf384]